ncbi:Pleckstrin_homology domain [Hexamita inflata]|uniref:Pleckstrin homology domain n=1 Tax=Hexamita inflata TaxID=28002 RepID=A0AA86QCS4_9EUKA|nr:Pleckstrin homology domain [Hexamita inflata]CAI9953857.1 Pleckstrin homology domain [Hexamita inflata]
MLQKISQEQFVIKQQTVLKLGGIYRNFNSTRESTKINSQNRWDRRYLILTDRSLYWLEDKMSQVLKNSILIKDITKIQKISGLYLSQKFVFKLYTQDKNYIYSVGTQEQLDDWVILMQKVTGKIAEEESVTL